MAVNTNTTMRMVDIAGSQFLEFLLKAGILLFSSLFFVYDVLHFVVLRPCCEVIVSYIRHQHDALKTTLETGHGFAIAKLTGADDGLEAVRINLCYIGNLKRVINDTWQFAIMASATVNLIVSCICIYCVFDEGVSTHQLMLTMTYCFYSVIDFADVAWLSQKMSNEVAYLYNAIHPEEMFLTGGNYFKLNMPLLVSLTTEPRTIESGKCMCRYGSLDYKSPFVGNKQPAELSPFYALKHFPGTVSPFTEALQEMARSEADLISIEAEQEARRVSQLEKIIQLLPAPCNALHVLQISGTYPKLSVAAKDYVQLMTQEQKEFYQTNIVCESLSDLCVATMGQSSCLRWHKEKKFRISSTTSHTILHARQSPEEVARAILNSRPFSTEATAYGLRTEPLAQMEFERQLGVEVVEGLVAVAEDREITPRQKRLEQLEMPLVVTAVGRKRLWMKLWQRPDESNMQP
ncbi:hypothetical protein HPB49_013918 [Dermacentor silvarum]|uniref:Uncharacterized protein n=1 Tax=Dermacentor silvarum TaxID=543639 RepID=A0ACB8C421_DERSI|nr:hypothetical protein HPB49_013918 [Dermacentor silvarum]